MKKVQFTKICKECNNTIFVQLEDHPTIFECNECGYPNVIGDMWDIFTEIQTPEKTRGACGICKWRYGQDKSKCAKCAHVGEFVEFKQEEQQ